MAVEPTTEAAAKEILRLAVWKQNTKANGIFRPLAMQNDFLQAPWSSELLNSGLEYALSNGWISNETGASGFLVLTGAGFTAAPSKD